MHNSASAITFTHTPIDLASTPIQPYITILSNSGKSSFGKTIYLDENNNIAKKSGIMSGACIAKTVHIKDLTLDLPTIIANLKNHESIVYGWVPGTESGTPFYIYSKKHCINIGGPTSIGLYTDSNGLSHARWTKDNFQFSSLTMFDVDSPPSIPAHLKTNTLNDWLSKMDMILPNFSQLTRVVHESSSNRIVDENGTNVFPSGGLHIIVQIDHTQAPHNLTPYHSNLSSAAGNNKNLTPLQERDRWRHGLLVMADKVNMTYLETFKDGMKAKPLSIWDPVVLASSQRVSYDSEPVIEGDLKLSVLAPNISTYKGLYFDTSLVQSATPLDIQNMNSRFRINLNLNSSSNSLIQTEPTLRLDQTLITQDYNNITVLDLYAQITQEITRQNNTSTFNGSTKVRCQADWRGSSSWNAYFDLHKNGEPLVFDQGRDIKYVLSTTEANKLKVHMANLSISKLIHEDEHKEQKRIHEEFKTAAARHKTLDPQTINDGIPPSQTLTSHTSNPSHDQNNVVSISNSQLSPTHNKTINPSNHSQLESNNDTITHQNQKPGTDSLNSSEQNSTHTQTNQKTSQTSQNTDSSNILLPDKNKAWYEANSQQLLSEALKCDPLVLEQVITKISDVTETSKRTISRLAKSIEDKLLEDAKHIVGEIFAKDIKSVKDIDKVKIKKAEFDKKHAFQQEQNEKKISNIVKSYCFIKDMNKFYDLRTHTSMVHQAFNQIEEGAIDLSSGKPKEISASAVFKQQKGEIVDGLTWVPNRPRRESKQYLKIGPKRFCNTYCHPHQDTLIEPNALVPIMPYLELLVYLMPNRKIREVFLDHMAFTIQYPDIKINWQILLYGATRIGKDLALRPLAWYFGDLYNDIDPDDKEGGKWGDDYAKRKVVVYQEVHRPGDKAFMNGLKTKCATTGSGYATFNMKGGAKISHANLLSMYMMSNYEDPIHITYDDGRFFVISAMDVVPKHEDYYKKLINWYRKGKFELHKSQSQAQNTHSSNPTQPTTLSRDNDNGPNSGVHRVIQWLMARDLSHFNPGKLPFHTEAKSQVIENSNSDIIMHAREKLIHAEGIFAQDISVLTLSMLAEYLRKSTGQKVNTKVLGNELDVLMKTGLMKLDKKARVKANKKLGRKEQKVTLWRNPNYEGPETDADFESPAKLWDMYTNSRTNMKGVLGALANGF